MPSTRKTTLVDRAVIRGEPIDVQLAEVVEDLRKQGIKQSKSAVIRTLLSTAIRLLKSRQLKFVSGTLVAPRMKAVKVDNVILGGLMDDLLRASQDVRTIEQHGVDYHNPLWKHSKTAGELLQTRIAKLQADFQLLGDHLVIDLPAANAMVPSVLATKQEVIDKAIKSLKI